MLFENKSLIPIGGGSTIITSHHQYLHSLLSPTLTIEAKLYINEGSGRLTHFSIKIVMIVINTHICKHLLSLIFVIFDHFSFELVEPSLLPGTIVIHIFSQNGWQRCAQGANFTTGYRESKRNPTPSGVEGIL
jgi:hypothetical protein